MENKSYYSYYNVYVKLNLSIKFVHRNDDLRSAKTFAFKEFPSHNFNILKTTVVKHKNPTLDLIESIKLVYEIIDCGDYVKIIEDINGNMNVKEIVCGEGVYEGCVEVRQTSSYVTNCRYIDYQTEDHIKSFKKKKVMSWKKVGF